MATPWESGNITSPQDAYSVLVHGCEIGQSKGAFSLLDAKKILVAMQIIENDSRAREMEKKRAAVEAKIPPMPAMPPMPDRPPMIPDKRAVSNEPKITEINP